MPALHFRTERLRLEDPETPENHVKEWRSVFAILRDYVQPDSTLSLDEAVDRAAEFYTDGYRSSPINHISIILGDQIPYDNPAHTKLAYFLLALGKSRKWFANSAHDNLERAELNFYQRLNENLSDELIGPAGRLKEGEDPMDYVNAQAFRANLMSIDLMSIDLMSMGHLLYVVSFLEHAMIDAFNEDHSKEPPQVRDAWVMGAAQWIKWRAEEAFSLVQKPGDPKIQNERKKFYFWQSRKKNEAVEKKWPYTWNQWQAWKDGFRTVAGSEAYSSTCRTIAEEAADLMGMQEKDMANHYIDSPLEGRS